MRVAPDLFVLEMWEASPFIIFQMVCGKSANVLLSFFKKTIEIPF